MKRSKSCIAAGIIMGAVLLSGFPSYAQTEYTEVQGECIELSIEDAQLLMQVAWSEAGDQGPDGMWLVMCTIMNRVSDPAWPSTIQEVVKQKSQFAKPAPLKSIGSDAHLALAKLESGSLCPEIVGFEVSKSEKLKKYFDEVFTYKDHTFYVKKEQ